MPLQRFQIPPHIEYRLMLVVHDCLPNPGQLKMRFLPFTIPRAVIHRLMPRLRQQFPERKSFVSPKKHDDVGIFPVELIHKFPASATRGQNHTLVVDGDYFFNPMFPMCDHGRDRTVFRAKTHTARRVDTASQVNVILIRH
jgi:hypothetical protein